LWARWRSPHGERVHSFTILTTDANATLQPLHDRMPVVLPPEHYDAWLDAETDPKALLGLLRPAPEEFFEAWPVSRLVNSADVDEPMCVFPATEGEPFFG
jgi:putative SOS response-associated peptidase YedK